MSEYTHAGRNLKDPQKNFHYVTREPSFWTRSSGQIGSHNDLLGRSMIELCLDKIVTPTQNLEWLDITPIFCVG